MVPPPLKSELCLKGNTRCFIQRHVIRNQKIISRYVPFACIQKQLPYSQYCLRDQEQRSDDDNDRDGARIGDHRSPDSEHRLLKSLRSPNNEERNSTRDRCVFFHILVHFINFLGLPNDPKYI
jgi:hypothetical protein